MIRKITFKTSDTIVTRIFTSELQENSQNYSNTPDPIRDRKSSKRRKKRENLKRAKTFDNKKDSKTTKKRKRRTKAEITKFYEQQRDEKQIELMKYFEASTSNMAKFSEKIEASVESIKTSVEELRNLSPQNKIIIVSENFLCDKPVEKLLAETRGNVLDIKNEFVDSVNKLGIHKSSSMDTQEAEVKPKLSRKFLPPMLKYRMKEKAASEAMPPDTELSVIKVRNLFVDDIPDNKAELKEMMDIDHELTELLDEINKSDEFKPTASVDNSFISSEIESISKLHATNAWLATKQATWCVKQSKVLSKMLERTNLVSTYKCMAKNCSYTTISTRNFEKHLVCHETTVNVCKFQFYCPYCFFKGTSIKHLVTHYEIHIYDRYQCPYCFYRSSSEESCFEHVICHHDGYPTKIYECPLETSPFKMDMERLQRKRKQFVNPLHCSCKIIIICISIKQIIILPLLACNLNFFCCDKYQKHIEQHILHPFTKTMALRDAQFYQQKLMNNKVGQNECLFCNFGTDIRR